MCLQGPSMFCEVSKFPFIGNSIIYLLFCSLIINGHLPTGYIYYAYGYANSASDRLTLQKKEVGMSEK